MWLPPPPSPSLFSLSELKSTASYLLNTTDNSHPLFPFSGVGLGLSGKSDGGRVRCGWCCSSNGTHYPMLFRSTPPPPPPPNFLFVKIWRERGRERRGCLTLAQTSAVFSLYCSDWSTINSRKIVCWLLCWLASARDRGKRKKKLKNWWGILVRSTTVGGGGEGGTALSNLNANLHSHCNQKQKMQLPLCVRESCHTVALSDFFFFTYQYIFLHNIYFILETPQ